MIVTFKSKASGDLIYFKDAALKLLKLMGRDEKVPSALYAEDVAAALQQLQQGLAEIAEQEKAKAQQQEEGQASSDGKKYISLNTRAIPLLEMLQKAQKKQCPVSWE
ncbi:MULTISPECIES: DUF1840 domain-containing protein [Rheinheimera]|uniref:DUF1840 domain-containing protein n=1 Tax=Rheinheimera TaxID=67575 RepID=UPI001416F6B3|nr:MULTISPECIES: DUF1840 domain-containing protein [Rheinheimera]